MLDRLTLFRPPGFDRQFISTSRGRLNYYQANDGCPETIVFLHGFGGGSSSFEWSKVYPAFTADYRVLAPDLPGWGYSEHRDGEYTAQDYRVAIREFIETLGRGPVTVVASSVVAGLAAWTATETADLFKRLVLMNPAGLKDFGKPYDGSFFALVEQLPVLNELLYAQVITSRWSVRRFLETRLFVHAERISDEIVEAYYVSAQQENGRSAAYSFLKGNFSFDLAEKLPALQVPTAILWGEHNSYEPPSVGQRLAGLSAAIASFEVIPDVGLTPQLELPAVTVGAIRRSLATLASTVAVPA